MKKSVVLALLLILSCATHAEWVKFSNKNITQYDLYVAPDTMRKAGSKVTFWELRDYVRPLKTSANQFILSEKIQKEFDCENQLGRLIYTYQYSGKMGGGKSLNSYRLNTDWRPIAPGTVDSAIFEIVVCR